MAKKIGRPKSSDRDDITVKVDRTLAGRARIIANERKVTLAEYLSELIRGPIDKEYAQVVRKLGDKGVK